MKETFDIFLGTSKKLVMWMACVEGLGNARERMKQLAADSPGQYILFATKTHGSVYEIESFAIPRPHPVPLTKANSNAARRTS
jgi:hypothetical protein